MHRFNDTVNDQGRRSFLKHAAYVTPAILTLKAEPSFASSGSGNPEKQHPVQDDPPKNHPVKDHPVKDHPVKDQHAKGNNGVGNGEDPQPPGNPPINDGSSTGRPGNRGHRR
jgi:hypothetical protein